MIRVVNRVHDSIRSNFVHAVQKSWSTEIARRGDMKVMREIIPQRLLRPVRSVAASSETSTPGPLDRLGNKKGILHDQSAKYWREEARPGDLSQLEPWEIGRRRRSRRDPLSNLNRA